MIYFIKTELDFIIDLNESRNKMIEIWPDEARVKIQASEKTGKRMTAHDSSYFKIYI